MDGNDVYVVTVTINDGAQNGATVFNVTVTDVDDDTSVHQFISHINGRERQTS